jgi:hypothetical protein
MSFQPPTANRHPQGHKIKTPSWAKDGEVCEVCGWIAPEAKCTYDNTARRHMSLVMEVFGPPPDLKSWLQGVK